MDFSPEDSDSPHETQTDDQLSYDDAPECQLSFGTEVNSALLDSFEKKNEPRAGLSSSDESVTSSCDSFYTVSSASPVEHMCSSTSPDVYSGLAEISAPTALQVIQTPPQDGNQVRSSARATTLVRSNTAAENSATVLSQARSKATVAHPNGLSATEVNEARSSITENSACSRFTSPPISFASVLNSIGFSATVENAASSRPPSLPISNATVGNSDRSQTTVRNSARSRKKTKKSNNSNAKISNPPSPKVSAESSKYDSDAVRNSEGSETTVVSPVYDNAVIKNTAPPNSQETTPTGVSTTTSTWYVVGKRGSSRGRFRKRGSSRGRLQNRGNTRSEFQNEDNSSGRFLNHAHSSANASSSPKATAPTSACSNGEVGKQPSPKVPAANSNLSSAPAVNSMNSRSTEDNTASSSTTVENHYRISDSSGNNVHSKAFVENSSSIATIPTTVRSIAKTENSTAKVGIPAGSSAKSCSSSQVPIPVYSNSAIATSERSGTAVASAPVVANLAATVTARSRAPERNQALSCTMVGDIPILITTEENQFHPRDSAENLTCSTALVETHASLQTAVENPAHPISERGNAIFSRTYSQIVSHRLMPSPSTVSTDIPTSVASEMIPNQSRDEAEASTISPGDITNTAHSTTPAEESVCWGPSMWNPVPSVSSRNNASLSTLKTAEIAVDNISCIGDQRQNSLLPTLCSADDESLPEQSSNSISNSEPGIANNAFHSFRSLDLLPFKYPSAEKWGLPPPSNDTSVVPRNPRAGASLAELRREKGWFLRDYEEDRFSNVGNETEIFPEPSSWFRSFLNHTVPSDTFPQLLFDSDEFPELPGASNVSSEYPTLSHALPESSDPGNALPEPSGSSYAFSESVEQSKESIEISSKTTTSSGATGGTNAYSKLQCASSTFPDSPRSNYATSEHPNPNSVYSSPTGRNYNCSDPTGSEYTPSKPTDGIQESPEVQSENGAYPAHWDAHYECVEYRRSFYSHSEAPDTNYGYSGFPGVDNIYLEENALSRTQTTNFGPSGRPGIHQAHSRHPSINYSEPLDSIPVATYSISDLPNTNISFEHPAITSSSSGVSSASSSSAVQTTSPSISSPTHYPLSEQSVINNVFSQYPCVGHILAQQLTLKMSVAQQQTTDMSLSQLPVTNHLLAQQSFTSQPLTMQVISSQSPSPQPITNQPIVPQVITQQTFGSTIHVNHSNPHCLRHTFTNHPSLRHSNPNLSSFRHTRPNSSFFRHTNPNSSFFRHQNPNYFAVSHPSPNQLLFPHPNPNNQFPWQANTNSLRQPTSRHPVARHPSTRQSRARHHPNTRQPSANQSRKK